MLRRSRQHPATKTVKDALNTWNQGVDAMEIADAFLNSNQLSKENEETWNQLIEQGLSFYQEALDIFKHLERITVSPEDKKKLATDIYNSVNQINKTKAGIVVLKTQLQERLANSNDSLNKTLNITPKSPLNQKKAEPIKKTSPTFFKKPHSLQITKSTECNLRELKEHVLIDELTSRRETYLIWNEVPGRHFSNPTHPLPNEDEAQINLFYEILQTGALQKNIPDEILLSHADDPIDGTFWKNLLNVIPNNDLDNEIQEKRQVCLLTFAAKRVYFLRKNNLSTKI